MREDHDHGRPDIRCLECITDAEWELVPDKEADSIAEAANWVPAHAVWIDLTAGILYGGEEEES